MTQPLLIGGATTSRAHTAIKIATNTDSPVVYVPDASRAVGVATKLLSTEQKAGYIAGIATEYEAVRAEHAGRKGPTLVSLADARTNRFTWNQPFAPVKPKQLGLQALNPSLSDLALLIDWTPFFMAWELAGKYPAILTDEVVGVEATRLHNDALKMLDRIVKEQWLQAHGVAAAQ